MMLFLLFLFLLIVGKEISGLECVYSVEPFESSISEFNLTLFESKIIGYPSYDYKDDNINMCRVEIYIDYQSDWLIVSFADSFQWYELDNGEARLDFLIIFDENNTDVQYYNLLQYACYQPKQCDILFVYNHIQWLINVNYSIIQTHLRSLLFNSSNPTESCYIDKVDFKKCSTGVCVGKYAEQHKSYLFDCHKNDASSVEIHITTSMIVEKNSFNQIDIEQGQIIRYICKFNKCNHQTLTDSIVQILQNDYQLIEMKCALQYCQEQPQETDSITNTTFTEKTTIQMSTINPTAITTTELYIKNSSKKPSSRTIDLILLFFILFI